jgi:hypothetical protein
VQTTQQFTAIAKQDYDILSGASDFLATVEGEGAQVWVFLLELLAADLEQRARFSQTGGHLSESHQYATPDAFVPTLPHTDYV